MPETLLIYYQPHTQHSSWALINEQGHFISQHSHGKLSDIGAIAKGRRATVLIDSSCLNIDSVRIPGQNKQRQLQAVPFALEEQLASDIDDMHFALGKRTTEQGIAVICISKALLQNTLQQFRQANISIAILAADALALPCTKKSWTALINGNSALIKTDHNNGYYCDRENLAVILTALLSQDNTPASLTYYHKKNDPHAANLLASIDISLTIKTYSDHPLEIFAANLTDTCQVNILQGEFTARRQSNLALKPWKAAASLFAAWMLVQMIATNIEGRQLQKKNQALTSQIEKEFKRANPTARKFNNMRKRTQQKLKQLRTGGSEGRALFLQILADAAPAFSQNKKVNIRGIIYRNHYVDMDLQADSLQSLEGVKNSLTANRKLKAVMSTSVEKNKTRGRLRLEAQG
jgi:general secretion pathway protein L